MHYSCCVTSLISVVNVRIVENSAPTVLRAFAECLQSLPNVHTLHIVNVVGRLATVIKTAFKGHRFLPIRTVILPVAAHHILSGCPQLRDVTCTGFREIPVVSTIAKRCKMVEGLDIMVYTGNTIDSECSDSTST
jgi:hypothetical protein